MKIRINNKFNIIPIVVFWLWLIFSGFLIFTAFLDKPRCGTMMVLLGVPVITLLIALFTLLILSIINLFFKKKYYTDYEFISIPFLIMILIYILKMFI